MSSGRDQDTAPQRILLASNYSNRTGYAWRNIHGLFNEIARHFQEHGVEVVASFRTLEPPVDVLDGENFVAYIPMPPKPVGARQLWKTFIQLRALRVRGLYLTDQHPVSWHYLLYRLAGVRRIVVHSRVSVPDPRPALPETGIKGLLKWSVHRIPFVRADRIYAVSNFVRDRLVRKARIPADRVRTILNGIDLGEFEFPSRPPDPSPLRIVAMGRATEHKGIDVLIRATHLLRSSFGHEDFVVEYAGDGPDLERFKALAMDLGVTDHFRFLGELDGTSELLERCDIVVVPSVWGDACPSSVAEGLASGRPLVATEVGGVPQQVGHPDNAILVPPEDASALACALDRLARDPDERFRLGRNGRSRALEALGKERYHREVLSHLLRDLGYEAKT